MKTKFNLLILSVFFLCIGGCSGDSFASLFHEMNAVQNEAADAMIFITDEDSAAAFQKLKMEGYQKRWSDVGSRLSKFLEKAEKPEKHKIMNEFIDFLDPYLEVQMRLKSQVDRLKALRYKLYLEKYGHIRPLPVVDFKTQWPQISQVMEIPKVFDLKTTLPENPFQRQEGMGPGGAPGMPGMPGMPGGGMPGGGIPGGPGPIPGMP